MAMPLTVHHSNGLVRTWTERMASPWLTLLFFLLAAAGSLAAAHKLEAATALMALPFTLLGLNLVAAVIAHPRFRADLPLLVFHLALLALVLLFTVGRLTYFDGRTLLTRGEAFDGSFESEQHGPLHGDAYRRISFVSESVVEGDPSGTYRDTRNRVRWRDPASGAILHADINNDRPLLLAGYRIYPMRFRGFSPRLAWQDANGRIEYGTVQLPPLSARQEEFPRGTAWRMSSGEELWAQILTSVPTADLYRRINLGTDRIEHRLVIRQNDVRHELLPGQSVALNGGRLTYMSLDSWLAYRIVRDPTEPWLAAAVVVAIASLTWFYARRVFRRPLDEDDSGLPA